MCLSRYPAIILARRELALRFPCDRQSNLFVSLQCWRLSRLWRRRHAFILRPENPNKLHFIPSTRLASSCLQLRVLCLPPFTHILHVSLAGALQAAGCSSDTQIETSCPADSSPRAGGRFECVEAHLSTDWVGQVALQNPAVPAGCYSQDTTISCESSACNSPLRCLLAGLCICCFARCLSGLPAMLLMLFFYHLQASDCYLIGRLVSILCRGMRLQDNASLRLFKLCSKHLTVYRCLDWYSGPFRVLGIKETSLLKTEVSMCSGIW